MRIIALVGSPHEKGNTDLIIEEIFRGAKSSGALTEKIMIYNKEINFCNADAICKETGKCDIEDDMQEIYQKLLDSDILIFGSPVYYNNISAQLKVVMDRCYALSKYRKSRLRGKKGVIVTVCATADEKMLEHTHKSVKNFFDSHQIELIGELKAFGFGEKGAVLESSDILKKAYELGERLAK